MTQRLIATVPDDGNGFSAKYYWDDDRPEYDRLHTVRTQIVDSVLEANNDAVSAIHNQTSGFGNKPLHHVARIPLAQIEKWISEEGFNWFQSTDAERKKILNDPKYAKYRTRRSRL